MDLINLQSTPKPLDGSLAVGVREEPRAVLTLADEALLQQK